MFDRFLLSFLNTVILPILAVLTVWAEWAVQRGLRRLWARSPRKRLYMNIYRIASYTFLAFFFGFSLIRMFRVVDLYPEYTFAFGAYVCVYSFKYTYACFVTVAALWAVGQRLRRRTRRRVASVAEAQPASAVSDASQSNEKQPITRGEFLNRAAVLTAAVPVFFFVRGIIHGRYAFRVVQREVFSPDLPLAFDGFRITHLSDFHVGSFDSPDAVAAGLQMANDTRPDAMLFTGDIVNQRSSELDNWAELFGTLRGRQGVFSVRGNHDYGKYYPDFTPEDCLADGQRLLGIQRQMGYMPLEDEFVWLSRGTSRIALVGMGNWGRKNPVKTGDLNRALSGVPDDGGFKILMSHDPSAWDALVRPHPMRIHLTLSGHTHGMQMGIDFDEFRWSPIQYTYPQWADLYRQGHEHLYVNRGFGYVLFPGRVGVPPEITVLTLRRGEPRG